MSNIKSSDITTINSSIYSYGTQSKYNTNLPSALQSETGNNPVVETPITPINIENIKTAIKTLQQKFSNNCCQSNCTATSYATGYTTTYVTNQCNTAQCRQCGTNTNCSDCYWNNCGYNCSSD